jgi:tRNA1Val (adenine37-N6)-methyltransferase
MGGMAGTTNAAFAARRAARGISRVVRVVTAQKSQQSQQHEPVTQAPPRQRGQFLFRHFSLRHDACAQKMGTDAMLLGAWAEPPAGAHSALDVGTGCGVLALMVAQKTVDYGTAIDAIDIEADAVEQATSNATACPWATRLRVCHASVQSWAAAAAADSGDAVNLPRPGGYDLIVSNPPFFVNSSKSATHGAAAARHADVCLPHHELAGAAAALLTPTGRMCVVLPHTEAVAFTAHAAAVGLALSSVLHVFTRAGDAAPKRSLLAFEQACATAARPPVEDQLVIMCPAPHGGYVYSDAYCRLTADYHHPSLFRADACAKGDIVPQ